MPYKTVYFKEISYMDCLLRNSAYPVHWYLLDEYNISKTGWQSSTVISIAASQLHLDQELVFTSGWSICAQNKQNPIRVLSYL